MITSTRFHLASLALFALVVFAAPLGAAEKLSGLSFGAFFDGRDPTRGATVSESELFQALQPLAPVTRWVRTFGVSGGLEHAGRHAHALGMKIAVGAWLGRSGSANDAELARVIALAQAGEADLVIVGSETLLRGDLSVSALIEYVRRVRVAVPAHIPVTTADAIDIWIANPALIAAVDRLLVNVYPFWRGVPIERALASVDQVYRRLLPLASGKTIVISETGWPSAGNPVHRAIPSDGNAAAYLRDFLAWARARNLDYYYFSARSELYKRAYEGEQGAHWGVLFDRFGRLLPSRLSAMAAAASAPDTWTVSQPVLAPLYVPRRGSAANLVGLALGMNPTDHRIVVYIRVGGWWVKPYAAAPMTTIAPDGVWSCDITTGGNDAYADRITVFLVPASFSPPVLLGRAELPATLDGFTRMDILRPPSEPPRIEIQPQSQTVLEGNSVSLSVVDRGSATMAYQWRRNGVAIAGATSATLTLGATTAASAGNYTVVVSNSAGSVASTAATVTVQPAPKPPTITTEPAGQVVPAGSAATLSATAAGTEPLTWQWLKNGTPIPGANSSSLTFSRAGGANSGTYSVRVTNAAGSIVSLASVLTVARSALSNLSVRATTGSGSTALIAGFVVSAGGPKRLLIRGVGPGLSGFGVPGALSDPEIALHNASGLAIARNDDWSISDDAGTVAATGAAIGAFPLAVGSRDAALMPALVSGAYTVRLAGKNASGTALLEVYEAGEETESRLINLSAIHRVRSASEPLIAGFVISGNLPREVLIRAVGPGLVHYGVSDPLADPRLSLHAGNELRAANEHWGSGGDAAALVAAASRAGAFPLLPGSRDSALLATLTPGAYTAVAGSGSGASGFVLIEVYDLDR